MSDDNGETGETSPVNITEEEASGPLVNTGDTPEADLVDEQAEPTPLPELSHEGWVGNGPHLCSGPGSFARFSGHNVDIHKLPEMSCAPGIPEAWKLREVGYSKSKQKVSSQPPLYSFVGAELISSANPIDTLGEVLKLPGAPDYDCKGLPHTLLVNLQLPECEKPALFGQQLGGKTVNSLLLFRLEKDVLDTIEDEDMAPTMRLLRRFISKLTNDVVKNTVDDFLGRFKLFVRSADGVPSAFSKYNGKPVLITGSGRFKKDDDGIMEIGVNMRNWAYPSRLALYSNWDRLYQYRLHVGVCIEGRCDEELNERLLGCCMLALPTLVRNCPGLTKE